MFAIMMGTVQGRQSGVSQSLGCPSPLLKALMTASCASPGEVDLLQQKQLLWGRTPSDSGLPV